MVVIILALLSMAMTLRGNLVSGDKHLQISDTGNYQTCFDMNYNKGYADFLLNPLLSFGGRGNWGIKICIACRGSVDEYPKELNVGTWQQGDGPLHDLPAEDFFLLLRELHVNYCLHVNFQFTPLLQEKLNDFFFARNQYSLPVANDTQHTFTFDVTVNNGVYIVNGNKAPVLTLSKGSTYSFYLTQSDFSSYPLTIGTAVGTPFPSTQTTEIQLVKITFTLPFNGPSKLYYYSSNNAATGNSILFNTVPNAFTIVPLNGAYYFNGQLQPTLNLFRGTTYTFQLKNTDQTLAPFAIGLSLNNPYSAVTVVVGSYYTTFTLTVTDPSISSLIYYSTTDSLMSGVINFANVAPVSKSRRRLFIGNNVMPNCTGTYGNPRLALQMSLYCMVANINNALPPSLTSTPYVLSSTCDVIARAFLNTQVFNPLYAPPYRFCSQEPINGVDSCTVNAHIGAMLPTHRTCQAYCSSFPGLTCAAANVSNSGFYNGYCMKRRPWSCNQPVLYDDKLICTCVHTAAWTSSQSSGVRAHSNVEVSPTPSPAIVPIKKLRSVQRNVPKRPTVTPTFAPSAVPTFVPTLSPVVINPTNSYISTACLKILNPILSYSTAYLPLYLPLSNQDLNADTCTVVAIVASLGGNVNRTCSNYCQKHGLTCIGAFDNYGYTSSTQRLCNTTLNNYYSALCQCADIVPPVVAVLNPDINTKTCQQLAFYGAYNVYTKPNKFCPNNLIYSTGQDSCTVTVSANPSISCGTFCSQYPGLTCLYGTYGSDDGSCSISSYGYLGCNVISDRRMICTCGIDTPSMNKFIAKKNETFSPACINMLLTQQPYYFTTQFCYSDLANNLCLAWNRNTVSCNTYCASFTGMTCTQAFNTPGSCQVGAITAQQPQPSCDTVQSNLLCQCGFAPGATQQNSMQLTLINDNLPYCPAYPNNWNISRRLNDQNDGYYGRTYKLLTLNVDYDEAKSDGSAKIVGLKSDWDIDDGTTDTYQSATPEMCTGLTSLIRPGDPPSKCSFGHRLNNNSVSSNCYGKIFGMNFNEASQKCAARGGQLAQVDTLAEFQSLLAFYVHDGVLSIGLHDTGGNNWKWDGSNTPVSNSWFNSTIPFQSNSWTDDCVRINFMQGRNHKPFLDTTSCMSKNTYLCEGIPNPATPGIGGDLLADEGGFCIWYYNKPSVSLPNDQTQFQNSELAHFLLYDQTKTTNKYIMLYNTLYGVGGIAGHPQNKANWDTLTRRKIGQNNDNPVFPSQAHNYSYHCTFSPTNFGISRIYSQQYSLERLYTGSAHQHCFCGYKYLGFLVDRCDCTRGGDQNDNCQSEHTQLLYTETFAATGEYVSCNNCYNQSP